MKNLVPCTRRVLCALAPLLSPISTQSRPRGKVNNMIHTLFSHGALVYGGVLLYLENHSTLVRVFKSYLPFKTFFKCYLFHTACQTPVQPKQTLRWDTHSSSGKYIPLSTLQLLLRHLFLAPLSAEMPFLMARIVSAHSF